MYTFIAEMALVDKLLLLALFIGLWVAVRDTRAGSRRSGLMELYVARFLEEKRR